MDNEDQTLDPCLNCGRVRPCGARECLKPQEPTQEDWVQLDSLLEFFEVWESSSWPN